MYMITGGMRFIICRVLEVAPMGPRGGLHHGCDVTLCFVWYLVPHILDQLPVCPSKGKENTGNSYVTVIQECHINIRNTRNSYVTVIQEISMYCFQDVFM